MKSKKIIGYITVAAVVVAAAAVAIALFTARRGSGQNVSSISQGVSPASLNNADVAAASGGVSSRTSAGCPASATGLSVSSALKAASPAKTAVTVYKNGQYGFQFDFSSYWKKGYRMLSGSWKSDHGQTGPLLTFRNANWTAGSPTTDIPLEIFTVAQWDQMQNLKFHVGGSQSYPLEVGRNAVYVFALDSRWSMYGKADFSSVRQMLKAEQAFQTLDKGAISVQEAQRLIAQVSRESYDMPLPQLTCRQTASQTYAGHECYTFDVVNSGDSYDSGTYLVGIHNGVVYCRRSSKTTFTQVLPHRF